MTTFGINSYNYERCICILTNISLCISYICIYMSICVYGHVSICICACIHTDISDSTPGVILAILLPSLPPSLILRTCLLLTKMH